MCFCCSYLNLSPSESNEINGIYKSVEVIRALSYDSSLILALYKTGALKGDSSQLYGG